MSGKPPVPKRGAFPTPKDVRDKAPPYIPDDDAADDQQDAKSRSPDPAQPKDDQKDTDK